MAFTCHFSHRHRHGEIDIVLVVLMPRELTHSFAQSSFSREGVTCVRQLLT